MCSQNKFTVPVLCLIAAINFYFLYRYSNIEYSIATDTEVIIRKLISIENRLTQHAKE